MLAFGSTNPHSILDIVAGATPDNLAKALTEYPLFSRWLRRFINYATPVCILCGGVSDYPHYSTKCVSCVEQTEIFWNSCNMHKSRGVLLCMLHRKLSLHSLKTLCIMFCECLRFEAHFSIVCLDYTKQAFTCQWTKSGLVTNRRYVGGNIKKRGTHKWKELYFC